MSSYGVVDHSCLVIAISDHEGVRLGDHSCLVIVISDQYGNILMRTFLSVGPDTSANDVISNRLVRTCFLQG